MSVLMILIPVSVVLAGGALVACILSIKEGQYDDLESPPWRILFDNQNNNNQGN